MNLGIDASNLREGGGLTHLTELLQAADPRRYGFDRVTVWGGAETLGRLSPFPWLKKVHESLLDRELLFRLYWQSVRRDRLAAQERCDLLFLPGGSGSDFRPSVVMCQNMLPFEWPEIRRFGFSLSTLRYLLLRRAYQASFRRADGLVVLSDYAGRAVDNHVKRRIGKTLMIAHGVSERFRRKPRPQRELGDSSFSSPFRLLYVSTLHLYKHQWRVAEAVSRLRSQGISLTIDFVGPSHNEAFRRLKKVMMRLDPEGNFLRYHGAVPYSEIHRYYHNAELFVFGSTCENLPMILLEAMAAGLPIASSNRGPMPDVLDGAGRYFDPESVDSMIETISVLVRDARLRAHLAAEAFQRAAAYSWKRCAQETFSFLRECLQASVARKVA